MTLRPRATLQPEKVLATIEANSPDLGQGLTKIGAEVEQHQHDLGIVVRGGAKAKNAQGLDVLRAILNDPSHVVSLKQATGKTPAGFFVDSNGQRAALDMNLNFIYFGKTPS